MRREREREREKVLGAPIYSAETRRMRGVIASVRRRAITNLFVGCKVKKKKKKKRKKPMGGLIVSNFVARVVLPSRFPRCFSLELFFEKRGW